MPGSQDFAADPRNAAAMVSLNGRLVVGDGVWEGLRLHNGTLLFLNLKALADQARPHYDALAVHRLY